MISLDPEKVYDKIQHPLVIKTLRKKHRNRRELPQLDKKHAQKDRRPTSHLGLNPFPLEQGTTSLLSRPLLTQSGRSVSVKRQER